MKINIKSKKQKFDVFFDGVFEFEILAFSFLKTKIKFYKVGKKTEKIILNSEDEVYLNKKNLI